MEERKMKQKSSLIPFYLYGLYTLIFMMILSFTYHYFSPIIRKKYSVNDKLANIAINNVIFRITTNEGLASQLKQIDNLCKYSKKTQIYLSHISSLHYRQGLVNICDYLDLSCPSTEIICIDSSPLDIAKKVKLELGGQCVMAASLWNNSWTRREALRGNELNTPEFLRLVTTNMEWYYNDIKPSCILGYIEDLQGKASMDAIRIKFTDKSKRLLVKLKKEIGVEDSNIVVVQWRRGDQLVSRCKFISEHLKDDSFNCKSPEVFFMVLQIIRNNNKKRPIYIATNEQNKTILSKLSELGYLTMTS